MYYRFDLEKELTEEEQEISLTLMQLFVIPVIWNLLLKPCRTIAEEAANNKQRRYDKVSKKAFEEGF